MTELGWQLPGNAAGHGVALDHEMLLNLTVFAVLCLAAQGLLVAGLFLRRGRQPLLHRRWRLEYLPLLGLTMLFFSLAWRSQRVWSAMRYSGAAPAAMQVEAVGMQFAWYFRYPGHDAAFGRSRPDLIAPGEGNPLGLDPADDQGRDDLVRSVLVLPAGREVDVRLRALDVMHGFAVPQLRVKQNAIPGQVFHLHFTPAQPGEYSLLCTQVCGLGHYRMQAVVRVLPQPEFDAWYRKQQP